MDIIDKHSNYYSYILCNNAVQVENPFLILRVIQKFTERYSRGYIRFMLVANTKEPMCILYSDPSGKERLSKIIPITEVENLLNNQNTQQ